MSYTIQVADLNDPVTDLELRKLIKEANGDAALLPEKYLWKNIAGNASQPPFCLAAVENNTIISCIGFMANDFVVRGTSFTGYQMCWGVTHPLHRGKKAFSSIVEEAKIILTAGGAGFLYGIANNTSNPIFLKKLNFTEFPSLILSIPNIPFYKNFYFRKGPFVKSDSTCVINEEQVKDHKLAQFPGQVKVIQHNQSWIWGKVLTKKKLGITFTVFYTGGIFLAEETDLKKLTSKIFKLYKVLFVQFFICKTNTFINLLRGWKKPRMNGFIFYNFNTPPFKHFNVMIGVIDIF